MLTINNEIELPFDITLEVKLENNNDELYDYWLAKWAAAREIFEILTGEKWNHN